MSDEELLDACKIGLNISLSTTELDDVIKQKLLAVKGYLFGAGVSDQIMGSELAKGVIVLGVTDMWELNGGRASFSPMFFTLSSQLACKSNVNSTMGEGYAMKRKHVIELVPRTYSSSDTSESVSEGTGRRILAERKSIRQSEFYQAVANGFRPEISFVIWNYEYHGEDRLIYNGESFEIIRRYPDKDDREIELVCQKVDDANQNLGLLRDGF